MYKRVNLNNVKYKEIKLEPNQISLFDNRDELQIKFDTNTTSNEKLQNKNVRFKRLGKILNRHRRIESMINVIPFKLQTKRIILKHKAKAIINS